MASLMERAIGAARLDAAVYEEIEADETALPQATMVVIAAAVSTGIGAQSAEAPGPLLGIAAALLSWYVWAGVTYFVGTRILPEPATKADFREVLRVLGFSAAPGVLGVLAAVPGFGAIAGVVITIWQLATMVVALRQSLDYASTGRAALVCCIGVLVYVAAFAAIIGGVAAAVVMLAPKPA